MQAAIISVGSEILRGSLLDTNAQYFAAELTTIGLEVARVTQVSDSLNAIRDALDESTRLADVVIVTGGLGPTEDDLTREAVIDLTGESPLVDERIVDGIRQRFAARGDNMPERNIKQAWTIPSAAVVDNFNGTAPGWIVDVNAAILAILPGPPRENRPMWTQQVRPAIVPRISSQTIFTRTIKTIGIGESAVADAINELIAGEWPAVGTYAKSDGVHVSITANHPDRAIASQVVRSTTDEVIEALRPYVYAVDIDESLAAAVVQPVVAAGIQFGIVEIGSGGAFTSMVLSDPLAERGVAWANILPGATPPGRPGDSARESALQAARRHASSRDLGTVAAIVLHGHSSSMEQPGGEVGIALVHAGAVRSDERYVTGNASELRRRSGLFAAEFLWREFRIAAGLQPRPD